MRQYTLLSVQGWFIHGATYYDKLVLNAQFFCKELTIKTIQPTIPPAIGPTDDVGCPKKKSSFDVCDVSRSKDRPPFK